MTMVETVQKQSHPLIAFRTQLEQRTDQFKAALPGHISADKFKRIILTAVQQQPKLLDVDRRSFWNESMKCAQDGLLPDGREAVILPTTFKNQPIASYRPMIAGIRKKARNSGEIATWDVQEVHENDSFEFALGDDPHINHTYDVTKPRGKLIAVYSVCALKSGEKTREIMSLSDVHQVRDRFSDGWKAFKANRIRETPWSTAEGEMAKKTVARRHSKVIPMSTDLERVVHRDDEDFEPRPIVGMSRSLSLNEKLDAIAAVDPVDVAHDPETGEIIEQPEMAEASEAPPAQNDVEPHSETVDADAAPASEGAPDVIRDAALAKLRAAAINGKRQLRVVQGGLTPAERDSLTNDDWVALNAMAEKAGA